MEKRDTIEKVLDGIKNEFLSKYDAVVKKYEADVINLDRQLEETLKQQSNLKEQEKENNKKLKLQIEKLEEQKKNNENIEGQLKKEIERYNELNKKLQDDSNKIAENLKDSELLKKLADDELNKQKDKTKEYDLKLAALKKDFEANEAKKNELATYEKKLNVLERDNILQRELHAAKEKELEEKAIDLKLKEKNIKLEAKRISSEK